MKKKSKWWKNKSNIKKKKIMMIWNINFCIMNELKTNDDELPL